jgi:CheY-like chemotaxis protein
MFQPRRKRDLDIDSPGMSGLTAAEKILATMSVPIVISTGRADNEALDKAGRLNIQSFLVKPFR